MKECTTLETLVSLGLLAGMGILTALVIKNLAQTHLQARKQDQKRLQLQVVIADRLDVLRTQLRSIDEDADNAGDLLLMFCESAMMDLVGSGASVFLINERIGRVVHADPRFINLKSKYAKDFARIMQKWDSLGSLEFA